jgi:hypothetical protein
LVETAYTENRQMHNEKEFKIFGDERADQMERIKRKRYKRRKQYFPVLADNYY